MGSYQVGVLKSFVDYLPAEDIVYDVITGVSVGSINAMAIALHEKGNEKAAIDWMINLWGQLQASNIYTNWPLGIIQGLLYKEGIWNNLGEVEYLNRTLDSFPARKLYRKLEISTVDLDTGYRVRFNESLKYSEISTIVRASSSMPFAFPHTHYNNRTYVDGGTIWNLDLDGAIIRCLEEVEEQDIIVDVIMCNSAQNVSETDFKVYNTISNWSRYSQIKSFYGIMANFREIMRGYPDVDFRYFLTPQQDLPSGFLPLGFVHEDILKMIEIGKQEGKDAIDAKETAREKVDRLSRRAYLHPDLLNI